MGVLARVCENGVERRLTPRAVPMRRSECRPPYLTSLRGCALYYMRVPLPKQYQRLLEIQVICLPTEHNGIKKS